MNLLHLAGHLGSDAESRFTPNGQKVTTFRIATNARRGGKDETIWWRVTVWGERYSNMVPHLKKGASLIVIGEMSKPEIYTDKNGVQQVSLNITAEIIKFSPFGRAQQTEAPREEMVAYSGSSSRSDHQDVSGFADDQLPF